MKRIFLAMAIFPALIVSAQQENGKKNIENLCGCFNVEFKYAETFSPDVNYQFHERETINGGIEYIFPVVNTDQKLILQHLLVITDSMIVKHWREEWTYENPVIYRYQGNKTWVRELLKPEEVKGKWTQSVWEVSDAPRYQGISEWISTDGKTAWESTVDAPLPRREYSVRNDYNILKRENRIIINAEGWTHDQNNQKTIRENGTDKLLVEEKGLNTYKRTDAARCASAKAYWEKNKLFWTKVRIAWENFLATHPTVKLKESANDKPMHDHLFAIAREFADRKITETQVDEKLKETFDKYLPHEKTLP